MGRSSPAIDFNMHFYIFFLISAEEGYIEAGC